MESLKPSIKLYDSRDFSEVLNAGFAFLRENAKGIFKNVFAIAAPFALLAIIVQLVYTSYLLDMPGGLANSSNPFAAFESMTGSAFLSQLTSNLLVLITTLASMSFVKLYYVNGPQSMGLGQLWQETLSHLGRGIGVSILYALGVVGAMILLIIPGIYVAILWSLAIPLIVFENLGVGALGRSAKLLKGNWWRSFGILLVIGIITALISGAFALPMAIITGFNAYFTSTEGEISNTLGAYGILNILATLIAYFGSIVSYIILATVTSFYMGTLVEEQESKGLMAEIEANPTTENSATEANDQY